MDAYIAFKGLQGWNPNKRFVEMISNALCNNI